MKNNNTYYKLPILDGLELFNAKQHSEDFPFHTHNTFNITLVLDQPFCTKLPDRLLQAPCGAIVITNPNEVHATLCESKIGNSFFTFYLSPDVMRRLNGNKAVFFDDKIIYDDALFSQLYKIAASFESGMMHTETILVSALTQLIKNHSATLILPNKKINLFQQFLQEERFDKFSLEETAKTFGLDKYKFLRLFKQQTGLTPNNFIILKRIEKCKQLLQQQDDLLGIALETGFYDATHLCRYFKKFTGITPQAYRNA